MMRPVLRYLFLCAQILPLLAVACGAAFAQGTTTIHIDAQAPWQPPAPALYDEGPAHTPSGETIGVNSRHLTLDGKPWLPVMGEFHFSRYPESQWEEEILKMKASGVNVIATYVIWIHHEEIEGQFDWGGQRNLRAFAQLCAKHGMLLVARIGPWAHGEVRNGGFPDWVLQQGSTRENDPVYLKLVSAWYGQIGRELHGLLWKDGGPVIGVQLENEYSKRGPGAGDAHILELKKLAIESGLDVPLYLVTGWDNAAVPPRAVLPVFGGYAAAPWDGSIEKLPPSEVYAFRFGSRVSSNMGAMGAAPARSEVSSYNGVPFLTAEIGGGIQDTYHRRPVIEPDDTAAIFPVMLGSGVNLYGTYMFQGGENPEGKRSTLQESQATGYPNDLPVKSYDFQAPLGEFGQERPSLRKIKVFQYFLNSFGSDLAPMTVHAPAALPRGPADFSVPRAAVRSRGDAGFLFCNNYVRGYAMPARPHTQFEIALPGGTLHVPHRPVDIPSGAYFIWPFNFGVNGVTLRYSTAQLMTRLNDGEATTLVFAAIPGIAPEFALDSATAPVVRSSGGQTQTDGGVTYVRGITPGPNASIEVHTGDGKTLRLLVLSPQEAEDAWRVRIGSGDHLLITKQDFFEDQSGSQPKITLRSRGSGRFAFTLVPAIHAALGASLPLRQTKNAPGSFTGEAQPRDIHLQVVPLRPAGTAPPVQLGPAPSWRKQGAAEAPADDAWPQAGKWSITLPPGTPAELKKDSLSNLFLNIAYQGDEARLYDGSKLLTDNFFNGEIWTVGLRRFVVPHRPAAFNLEILPLRADAPIYLESGKKPLIPSGGQIGSLESIQLIPEYQLTITPQ